MVVKRGGSLVATSCVPRVGKLEQLKILMVTKLMAQCAQERAEGDDLLGGRSLISLLDGI